MSKKKRQRSLELPQVGNALEVPNYVTPTTDLEYRQVMDELLPRVTDLPREERTVELREPLR